MRIVKTLVALMIAGGLSACAGTSTVTRSADNAVAPLVPSEITALSTTWNVLDVRVNVPDDLRVSEANRYYPFADIVWRDDPYGDRHAQVAKILDDGLSRGLTHLNGDRAVYFDITLSRFHSLTEKARYSVGGVHHMVFSLTVVDALTNIPLHGPVEIELNLKAYGGAQAFEAERRGHTQKVRILSHLTGTMRRQFPGLGLPRQPASDVQVSRAAYDPLSPPEGWERVTR
ncbi:MAG: DUF6778 family protein [Pseudomonadota bacterium]